MWCLTLKKHTRHLQGTVCTPTVKCNVKAEGEARVFHCTTRPLLIHHRKYTALTFMRLVEGRKVKFKETSLHRAPICTSAGIQKQWHGAQFKFHLLHYQKYVPTPWPNRRNRWLSSAHKPESKFIQNMFRFLLPMRVREHSLNITPFNKNS